MTVQRQEIWQLNQKIEQLYAIVKQLGSRIGWEGVEDLCFSVQNNEDFELVNDFTARQKDLQLQSVDSEGELIAEDDLEVTQDNHKDILVDEKEGSPKRFPINSLPEDDISCEDQVQRLTAQLTAAYHRIASLEDQLLANRSMREGGQNPFYGHH
ncbi:hypothetical protein IQ215_04840 [Cyanobacterium stanieri LEGE 03274]|uniref:Uncharacterized protein n=1 Tax=Cyanobacterium stanieri LEGE 03274 TaxID=1828756 RepID=A0ABR9V5A6_9CHRO|nr:hypothetical protein [Cyanobacterium stanieri]MBE9222019.1 hypothetical protein [Cyanobacterium stanieri LEGE 03274]